MWDCEVLQASAGKVIFTYVEAMKALSQEEAAMTGSAWRWEPIPVEAVDDTNPEEVWFARIVRIMWSHGLVTDVREVVHAPNEQAAATSFEVPPEDLLEVATDPALVIPPAQTP